MAHATETSIGPALSIIDLLAVLYDGALVVDPLDASNPMRDRLIVSKSDAAAGLYGVLAAAGFFDPTILETFGGPNSHFQNYICHHVPGVEMSARSPGHGLPVGCGLAIALPGSRIFVVIGNRELDQGSTPEAIRFAAEHGLDNLTLIVEASAPRDELRRPLEAEKLGDTGWNLVEIDGHDHEQIRTALQTRSRCIPVPHRSQSETLPASMCGNDHLPKIPQLPSNPGRDVKPLAIFACTVNGKGVDFLENSPNGSIRGLSSQQLAEALIQVATC